MLLALAFTDLMARAQTNYSIDWYTIDGGGTSTGGVYSASGTIGQPDAGAMSGPASRHFVFDGGARKGEKKLVHET